MTPSTAGRSVLSLSAVAVAAFFWLVVLPRATMPLVDGDVWWHLRAGEEVLETGRVPAVDRWSIAGQGAEWVSQDWLANTAMAVVNRAHGQWGATLLSLAFGLAVALAFALLWRAITYRDEHVSWLWRIIMLTAGLIVAGPIIGVRVQTLDLLLASMTVWLLWRYLANPAWLPVIALPILTTVWVNTHAGFPMLFLLAGAVVTGEALDRWRGHQADRPPLSWAENARLVAGLSAAVPAVAINPNGLAMYAYPFRTAGIDAHRDFIFEWSRPDLSSFAGQVLIAFLVAVVVPTLWFARRRMRAADILWLVGLAAMSLMAIRFAIFIGPIGAAIAAAQLREDPGGAVLSTLARRMGRPPVSDAHRMLNAALVSAVAVAGVGVALIRSAPPAQDAAIAEAMPVRAVAWLRSEHEPNRIFNVYAWGGYVGREVPNALVYIDGRSDIFGDAILREYALVVAVERDPDPLLKESGVDTILFWPTGPFADWLNHHSDWTRVYADDQAAIWVRSSA